MHQMDDLDAVWGLAVMTSSFRDSNTKYEKWLRTQCSVIEGDLDLKHKRMKKSAFIFLRATYFRWAKLITSTCPELRGAPEVLSVGDAHVENFGTWRDAEGRLVWGVNDFDEGATMPYPLDLVRLAASVRLSPELRLPHHTAADAILTGYGEGLVKPKPTLLTERETWMQPYVSRTVDSPHKFWNEVAGACDAEPPRQVRRNLAASLPPGAKIARFASWAKGGGSLGRPRYLAIAEWQRGQVLREAKALVPSAWSWAHGSKSKATQFGDLANSKFRSPDPFLAVKDGFVLRRIAPDSHKVELGEAAGQELTIKLLQLMGFDLASIHMGSDNGKLISKDLKGRPEGWLQAAAKQAARMVKQDYAEWKSRKR